MGASPAASGPPSIPLGSYPCPLCGASAPEPEPALRRNDPQGRTWAIARCSGCQLEYLEPRPRDEALASLYDSSYGVFHESRFAALASRFLVPLRARAIARRLRPGASLLEVGCGTGRHLEAVGRRGLRVQGLEPSPHAAGVARQRGLDVAVGTLGDASYPERSFDAVLLQHVLEHLPEPVEMLRRVRSWLRPGGLLFASLPDRGSLEARLLGRHWKGYDVPFHLYFPTAAETERLLNRAGFELVRASHSPLPNDWAHGVELLLAARSGRAPTGYPGPIACLLFAPLAAVGAALGIAGRLVLVARRLEAA